MFHFPQQASQVRAKPMTTVVNQHEGIPVVDLENGARGRVSSIDGGRSMIQRLMSLGISKGSDIEILHHRGKSVVVGLNGNRIALGAGVANQIYVVLRDSCSH